MWNINRYCAINFTCAKKAPIYIFFQMLFFYIEISKETKCTTRGYDWATEGAEIPVTAAAQAQNCIYSLCTISLHTTNACTLIST